MYENDKNLLNTMELRKLMWEKIYSNMVWSREFVKALTEKYNTSITQDFQSMQFTFFVRDNVDENYMMELSSFLSRTVYRIIDLMYARGDIDQSTYNQFENRSNLYFNLTCIDCSEKKDRSLIKIYVNL